MSKVIAVDFDGCLCENKWPDIGRPNHDVIRALIRMRENGTLLILWTCREGETLDAAVAWCARQGLSFDAINDNVPERTQLYGNNCRKVGADEYWDDRAVTVRCS